MNFFVAMLIVMIACLAITYKTLAGYGHLPIWAKLSILALLVLAWFGPMFLRLFRNSGILTGAAYELAAKGSYFLMGFGLKQGLMSLPKDSGRNILRAVGIFVVAFCSFMLLKDRWQVASSFIEEVARLATFNICTLLTAMSLLYILYNLSNRTKVVEWLKAKPVLITLSGYCYGVYIYQQFILQYLYYKTSVPLLVNEYALPWIGFAVALVLSLLLCWVSLKTRVGRFLIG